MDTDTEKGQPTTECACQGGPRQAHCGYYERCWWQARLNDRGQAQARANEQSERTKPHQFVRDSLGYCQTCCRPLGDSLHILVTEQRHNQDVADKGHRHERGKRFYMTMYQGYNECSCGRNHHEDFWLGMDEAALEGILLTLSEGGSQPHTVEQVKRALVRIQELRQES